MHILRFSRAYDYSGGGSGITVPVVLSSKGTKVKLLARVDSGATFCIFQRAYGQALGLDLESGKQQQVATVTGSFLTYGHRLLLSVLGQQFGAMVYFAADDGYTRDVLGRQGWIQQVRLGIVDHDGKLYVSTYEE